MNGTQTAPSGPVLGASRINPSDRVLSRRSSIALLAWQDRGFQGSTQEWWDKEFPCAPVRARIETAETGQGPGARSDRYVTVIPSLGRERSHLKGGGLTMRRILAVLSALAALMLLGGANTKF
jgi:hypothetical protein